MTDEQWNDKRRKFVLKSVSDVLRSKGICVKHAPPLVYPITCPGIRNYWYGYCSQKGLLPNFNIKRRIPPYVMTQRERSSIEGNNKTLELPHRKISGIARFRKIVNVVKHQNTWKKESLPSNQGGQLKSFFGPMQANGTREILTFDVNYFKSDSQVHDKLGFKAKSILIRPPSLRSEQDIKYLYRYTLRLKCLRKYPIFVRMELSKCLLYDRFEKGRVVLKQGDLGYYFYFILTGSVLVEIESVNENTREIMRVIAGELKAGSSFGDIALLRESERTASIICHEDSEFLMVAKPDFDEVLKKNHQRELQHCVDLLHKHPLFKNWKPAHLDITIGSSKMVEYMHGEVIFKDMSVPSENIHCVVRGTCLVIQRVLLWECLSREDLSKLRHSLRKEGVRKDLLKAKEFSFSNICYRYFGQSLYQKVYKYWVIRNLREGDFLGLGEGGPNMSAVATDKTIILLVNKSVIREYAKRTDLGQLRAQLIKYYPTEEQSLRNHLAWKRQREYQKSVVLEAIGRRPESRKKDHYILASKVKTI